MSKPQVVKFGDGVVSKPKPDWSERTYPKEVRDAPPQAPAKTPVKK